MAKRKDTPTDAEPVVEQPAEQPAAVEFEPNVPFSQAKLLLERRQPGGSDLVRGFFLRGGEDDINRARPMAAWIQILNDVMEGR